MSGPRSLRIETKKDVILATFEDESLVDALVTQRITPTLFGLVDDHPEARMVLDFAAVRAITSGTLGMLITLKKKIDATQGRLIFCGLDREVRRLFEMTSLDRMFQIESDRRTALAKFGVAEGT